jgi:hypothetical protein
MAGRLTSLIGIRSHQRRKGSGVSAEDAHPPSTCLPVSSPIGHKAVVDCVYVCAGSLAATALAKMPVTTREPRMRVAPRLTVQWPVTKADTDTWVAFAMTARICEDILLSLVDPLPNSLLRDDDANYQWEKQSVWLQYYLRAAADHLLVWANIVNPLQVHNDTEVVNPPRAYLTLARGAIEASAQAGWVMLGTDATERTLRHLRLM